MTREWRFLQVGLVLADALALSLAFFVAYYIRFASGLLPPAPSVDAAFYLKLTAALVPGWIVIFALHHLYDPEHLLGGAQEYLGVVNGSTYGFAATVVIRFLYGDPSISRSWVAFCWPLAIILVGLTRFCLRRLVYQLRNRGLFINRALIVGANEQGLAIARQLEPASASGLRVVGFLDDYLPVGTSPGLGVKVLGEPMAYYGVAHQVGATEIIVVPHAVSWESLQNVVQSAAASTNGLRIRLSPGLYDLLSTGVRVSARGYVPLLSLNRTRITGLDALLKGVLDYGLSLVLLLLFLPVLAWLTFGRHRGLKRRRVVGSGEQTFELLALEGDSRFRWLPTLVNVLRGEMSLVGPKPMEPAELHPCQQWSTNLLAARPGLTGPWLLGGKGLPLEKRLQRDLYYLRNYTIWLDLQILFQTAKLALGLTTRPEEESIIYPDWRRPQEAQQRKEGGA